MIGRGAPAIGAIAMGAMAELFGFQAPVLVGAVMLIGLWWWAVHRKDAMGTALEGE